ncbi:MAG: glycosyltransferase family 4 protein [Solirubrobacterales bacterium]
MILFVHNRYRQLGGEERFVEALMTLVRQRIREPVELLERDSATLGRTRAAAALLRGGLEPDDVAAAVRRTGARVVHAHNLHPSFGWRSLAAARDAGAGVVLHLHNYRLVCAVGVCFTEGQECTRCHGRNTAPGLIRRCRGSLPEAATYAASLAAWQDRLVDGADEVLAPSAFAFERLRELGAPLPSRQTVVPYPVSASANGEAPPGGSRPAPYALLASRLAPEKGAEQAIDACVDAGVRLIVAGSGPGEPQARQRAAGADVEFRGWTEATELARLRTHAALAVVPSRFAETFGLAAAEAMAAGVPVVASRVGALGEIVPEDGLVDPGDRAGWARAVRGRFGDREARRRGREAITALATPDAVAETLTAVYARAERAATARQSGP